MDFNLNECVSFITSSKSKKLSEIFAKWLQPHNITRIQWVALYYINRNGEVSQRELSNLMSINDSSGMRLIERLERDGLVIRTRSDIDRRIICLTLSKTGKEVITNLLPLGVEFSNLIIKDIPADDLKIFNIIMDKMLENALNDEKSK